MFKNVHAQNFPDVSESQIEKLSGKNGWKSILLLQFQKQFKLAVLMGVVFSYVIVTIEASMAMGTLPEKIPTAYMSDIKSIIYAFDVFYFIDLLLMIIFKNTNWPEISHLYKSRNGLIISVEFLTLLPLDAIYYYVSKVTHMDVVYYMRLRYVLRLIRIFDGKKRLKSIDRRESLLKLIVTFFVLLYVGVITLSGIMHSYKCGKKCDFYDDSVYFMDMYAAAEKLTSKGFGAVRFNQNETSYFLYALCLVNFFSYIFLGYYTSKLVCNLINKDMRLFSFLTNYTSIKKTILMWRTKHMCAWTIEQRSFFATFVAFSEILWQNQRGKKSRMLIEQIMPSIMYREIMLDMSWNAFKHSHLFRDETTDFLRKLSSYVQHTFYVPGEIVYKKYETKSSMVYIVNGIVQICSEENGETPIISFSGGTCLGESTLVIDYPSTCTVIAKTYTEVTILKRKDFLKINKTYPKIFSKLVSEIKHRYAESKAFARIVEFQRATYDLEDYNLLTMIWLKRTLYNFLDDSPAKDDVILEEKLNESVFCAKYLDMLTLTEQLELISDTVFIKKKFPFIYQPKSIFIDGWNIFVGVVASSFAALYPWYLCNSKDLSYFEHALVFTSLSLVYICDVYFLMCTAVRTKDSFLTDISTITYYRLTKFTFIIDMLAPMPLNLIILTMHGKINPEALVLSEFHKLLKIYKVKLIFSKLEKLNLFNIVILKYVKVLLCSFFMLYYTTGLFYYLACGENGCPKEYIRMLSDYLDILDHQNKWKQFLQMYTMSAFFGADITTFDFMRLIQPYKYQIIVCIQMVYTFLYMYMLALAAIVETLKQRKTHEFREFVGGMEILAKDFDLSSNTRARINFHLKTSYNINKGFNFLYRTMCSDNMSNDLYATYRKAIYGDFLQNIPLFRNIPQRILAEISKNIKVSNFPGGEVITYAGEVCKEMHLIEFGYCNILCADLKMLKPEDCFCVIETCMKIPTLYTVTTLTDCKVVSLEYEKLAKIMNKYPDFKSDIFLALDASIVQYDVQQIQRETQNAFESDYVVKCDENTLSFRNFPYRRIGKKNHDYHRGFPRYLKFLKCVLMRHTITSYGKFLLYWEISRCVFAFGTNILTAFTNVTTDGYIFYFLLFFDVSAWIDLYVRHHVCYFNKMGIEVSHPLSTAVNYWKNGFLMDLIGAAPLDYLIKSEITMYIRINRLMQIHRIFGFIRYINDNKISTSGLYNISKYIPLTLLLVNYVSCLNLHITCDLDFDKDPETRLHCSTEFWLNSTNLPYNRISAHIACLMLTTATLSCIGFIPIRLRKVTELYISSFLVIIGQVFFIWLTARIVADNFYRKTDLTEYQEAMKVMLNFLNIRKIDKVIKKEVINYFEYMWEKTKAKNLNALLDVFNTAFKEDILYDMFGRIIHSSTIFPNASKSFFKSLLLSVTYEVYILHAIIYRVNDVHGYIFIILRGQVEILGPDYNRLLVLSSGSVFGNLDNCPLTRQTLTMVAKGHVELLKFKSTFFHSVLLQYPELNDHFQRLTAFNVDYCENYFLSEEELHMEITISRKNSVRFKSIKRFVEFYIRISRVYDGNWLNIWKITTLVSVCYIGFHVDLFQKATGVVSYLMVSMLYFFDIWYLCRMYLIFHTAYENEFGILVKDRRQISLQYLRKSLGFYFDLVAVAPIEIFSLVFINQPYFWKVWSWCRVNRLIRIVLVLNALTSNKERLNINVIVMRILYMICWITIVVQIMTNVLHFFRMSNSASTEISDNIQLLLSSYVIIIYSSSGAALTNIQLKFDQNIMICVVLIVLVSRFFMSMIIAVTCTSLEAINQTKNKYQKFATHMKRYMIKETVSIPLRRDVSMYINLLWYYHTGVQYPRLLDEAPYYLREAILNALFGFHLRKHPLIKQCHVDLIRQMAAALKTLIFFPGNYVTYEGDIDGCMYFIHKGGVDALSEDTLYTEVVEDSLGKGDVFGFKQGLYPRHGHEYTYKVTEYTIIVVLEREKWIHLLDFYPASKTIIYDEEEERKR